MLEIAGNVSTVLGTVTTVAVWDCGELLGSVGDCLGGLGTIWEVLAIAVS